MDQLFVSGHFAAGAFAAKIPQSKGKHFKNINTIVGRQNVNCKSSGDDMTKPQTAGGDKYG